MEFVRVFWLIMISCCVLGCSSDDYEDENGSNPISDAQIQGERSALASSQVTDYFDNTPVPDEVVDLNANGVAIIRTQAQLFFSANATVGEINDLLDAYEAIIVASVEGSRVLIVSFPDPGTATSYQERLDALLSEPLITDVVAVSIPPEPDMLPTGASFLNNTHLTQLDHHLSLNFHAAWNLYEGPWVKPQVLVADFFGLGVPSANLLSTEYRFPDHFANKPHEDSSHGYHVLGILGHSHSGQIGGALPIDYALDVVDLAIMPSLNQYEMALLARAKGLSKSSLVVINLSLGRTCTASLTGKKTQCSTSTIREGALVWIKMMREMDLENKVLVVAAAGNKYSSDPSIVNGVNNSSYTFSVYGSDLEDSEGITHPPLTNTLVVENASQTSIDAAGCVDTSSLQIAGAIAGVGTSVYSLISATGAYGNKTGTSMATPQVAGLAAYISAIKPNLKPQEIIKLIVDNTKQTEATADGPLCSGTKPANLIQPYETLLALDEGLVVPNGFGEDPSAVRRALMDVNDLSDSNTPDLVFDSLDISRFVDVFNDNEGIADEGVKDYGRFDLNGDKYSKGDNRIAFDLNANGLKDDILVVGEGDYSYEFNESEVSDWDVLCYYSFSPLYEGDSSLRETFIEDFNEHCNQAASGKIYFRSGPFLSAEIASIDVESGVMATESHITMSYAVYPVVDRSAGILAFTGRKFNAAINDFVTGVYFQAEGGSEPVLIARDAWDFSISPGTNKIVYEIADDLFISNFDGSDEQPLLVDGVRGYPAISPDGQFLAYSQYNDIGDRSTIQLMDLETGAHVGAITNNGIGEAYNAAWSPDSRYIAYELEGEIFIIDLETDTTTRLNTETQYRSGPTWSPDGTKIAFSYSGDIYMVNLDGTERINLTQTPTVGESDPYWSH